MRKGMCALPPIGPKWAYWDYAPHAAGETSIRLIEPTDNSRRRTPHVRMQAMVRCGEEQSWRPIVPLELSRALLVTLDRPQIAKGNTMPKDMHQKAAEHHEQAAKAHRTAAQQHGSSDHVSAKQQSAQAVEKSKVAHEQSTQAHSKSQQQK
jgi:hypothetical protein